MEFCVVGISHKTAPVQLREQVYLRPGERDLLLAELKTDPNVLEALVLSTCNRIEIYACLIQKNDESLKHALMRTKRIKDEQAWLPYFYSYSQDKAVRHLMEVACGLDSLIIGEKQIIGQLRTAIDLSRERRMLGRFLNILCNITLRTGKKVQHETDIGTGGSSVSWAAVKYAEEFFGTLEGRSILIIGAGKMSKLAASDLNRKGIQNLYLMNRTMEKGKELAGLFNAHAVGFWEIAKILPRVDICICSAGAPHYLLHAPMVQDIFPNGLNAEKLFIDISMPRNIDPQIGQCPRATVVTLDQLEQVVDQNQQLRRAAVYEVEKIITRKMTEFAVKYEKAEAHSRKFEDKDLQEKFCFK